jgi:isopentenyl-diphosphate delta-isomerase
VICRYVTPEELKEIFATAEEKNIKITPWFRLICNEFLFTWWAKLDSLKACKDPDTIHRL